MSAAAVWRTFATSVRADHRELQANAQRYARAGADVADHDRDDGAGAVTNTEASLPRLLGDAAVKVGFQLVVMVRVMRLVRDLRVPLGAPFVSRLIRHLYGADVHWDAEIGDGLAVVHGMGIVISHAASIGEHCLVFHGVTLGESMGRQARRVGAPQVGSHVHLGVGATLLGPITVGDHVKVGPGSLVDVDVPSGARVAVSASVVTTAPTASAPPGADTAAASAPRPVAAHAAGSRHEETRP